MDEITNKLNMDYLHRFIGEGEVSYTRLFRAGFKALDIKYYTLKGVLVCDGLMVRLSTIELIKIKRSKGYRGEPAPNRVHVDKGEYKPPKSVHQARMDYVRSIPSGAAYV